MSYVRPDARASLLQRSDSTGTRVGFFAALAASILILRLHPLAGNRQSRLLLGGRLTNEAQRATPTAGQMAAHLPHLRSQNHVCATLTLFPVGENKKQQSF